MKYPGLVQNIKTTSRKYDITTQFPRKKAIYTMKANRPMRNWECQNDTTINTTAHMEILVNPQLPKKQLGKQKKYIISHYFW